MGSLGPQKHDSRGRTTGSAIGGDGVVRGQTSTSAKASTSAKGTNACASSCTRPQGNAQSIIDEGSSGASSGHVDNLQATKAGAERKLYIARGPADRPVAGKTKTSHLEKKTQPMQGQTPQPTGQTSQPPDEQMPQSTQGQTSQLTQEQTLQPKQGETSPSQLAQKQTSQSPDSEQQTPQTTGGQKPKRRRHPATTATSDTTAGPRR